MQAIVICSVGNKGLYILLESIRQYAPELLVYVSGRGLEMYDQVKMRLPNAVWTENIANNFGDAYNAAVTHAFEHGGMTAITAATAADTFTNGSKTYKFTVGNNVGSYNAVVDLPAYVATDSAKTVGYTIATGVTEVSNAEVLAAIVKLIAQINKQIANLQKLLAKKK